MIPTFKSKDKGCRDSKMVEQELKVKNKAEPYALKIIHRMYVPVLVRATFEYRAAPG